VGESNIIGKHNPQNFRFVPGIPFETVTGEFSKCQKGNSWDLLEKKGESGGMSFDQSKFFSSQKNLF